MSVNASQIGFLHLAFRKSSDKNGSRLGGLPEYEDSPRERIEAVDWLQSEIGPRSLSDLREGMAKIATTGMHRKWRRFLHHEESPIFKEDLQLGGNSWLHHIVKVHLYLITRPQTEFQFRDPAIHPDIPSLDTCSLRFSVQISR